MYIYVTYIYIYNVFGRGAGLERAGDISRDAGWPIRTFDWRTNHKLTCLVFGTNLSPLGGELTWSGQARIQETPVGRCGLARRPLRPKARLYLFRDQRLDQSPLYSPVSG